MRATLILSGKSAAEIGRTDRAPCEPFSFLTQIGCVMPDNVASEYDRVFYAGNAFYYTHPNRLATFGSLLGMQPAPVADCRVLELGCGAGANLIPMAYQWPHSRFVGIDLSAAAIAQAETNVAALGLTNVELRQLDIMEIGPDFGQFDFIIAHGVYSWVPPAVRRHMMTVFKQNLAPQGIVYVSYNALPISFMRDLARSMVMFHVRGIEDAQERIRQSRVMMNFLAQASDPTTVYGAVVRDQHFRIQGMSDEVLYHDDLNPFSTPFYLYQVDHEARAAGLQYLGEATQLHTDTQKYPAHVREVIERIPADDVVTREQYQDFIDGNGFRRTLLCHAEVALRRDIDPLSIRNYRLIGVETPDAPKGTDKEAPKTAKPQFESQHAGVNAALHHLHAHWPQAFSFAELDGGTNDDMLARELYRAFCSGDIDLQLHAPPGTATLSQRPLASLLARRQAAAGASSVTSMHHRQVNLQDPTARQLLILLDGTRTLDDVARDLQEFADARPVAPPTEEEVVPAPLAITAASVKRHVELLGRLGLLIG